MIATISLLFPHARRHVTEMLLRQLHHQLGHCKVQQFVAESRNNNGNWCDSFANMLLAKVSPVTVVRRAPFLREWPIFPQIE